MDMEDPKSATTPVGIKGGHASIQQILGFSNPKVS